VCAAEPHTLKKTNFSPIFGNILNVLWEFRLYTAKCGARLISPYGLSTKDGGATLIAKGPDMEITYCNCREIKVIYDYKMMAGRDWKDRFRTRRGGLSQKPNELSRFLRKTAALDIFRAQIESKMEATNITAGRRFFCSIELCA
jgi:hypothetical protein